MLNELVRFYVVSGALADLEVLAGCIVLIATLEGVVRARRHHRNALDGLALIQRRARLTWIAVAFCIVCALVGVAAGTIAATQALYATDPEARATLIRRAAQIAVNPTANGMFVALGCFVLQLWLARTAQRIAAT
jgi:hypothetical protein